MKFIVPWTPKAKDRPGFAKGHAYTPKATKVAEAQVLADFKDARDGTYIEPLEGPLSVSISLANDHFEIDIEPHADYVNRKLRGDIDNYGKLILDALNGVAWVDDKQIHHLEMRKL